jgi:SAM-dependent methyltransferase
MPLLLSPEEHQAVFEANEAPAPVLDLLGAAAFRMAGTALKLGVFEALADGPLSADDVAARAGTHPRGTRLLLDALASYGYVRAGGDGRYGVTEMAEKWMLRASPASFATTVEFWDALLYELWGSLERSVSTGAPPTDWYRWLEENPRTQRSFHAMLGGIAQATAASLVQVVPVPDGPARLLDVGGAHARYALAFCRAHPQLKATVLDFPGALAVGRENAAAEGMGDRVAFEPGDFLCDPLPTGYDVVLLCSIVHGLSPAENRDLLRACFAALRPGGRIVVVEQLEEPQGGQGAIGDAFLRTFSLNMFHLQGAQTYRFGEIAGWLREAGFGPAEAVSVPDALDTAVVAARPAEVGA